MYIIKNIAAKEKKKKKISHFKMPTLNSDVTVNSYNNFYLFSMKYLYRNDSIWKFVTMKEHQLIFSPVNCF
jgi:hypothetical protein